MAKCSCGSSCSGLPAANSVLCWCEAEVSSLVLNASIVHTMSSDKKDPQNTPVEKAFLFLCQNLTPVRNCAGFQNTQNVFVAMASMLKARS